MIVRRFFTLIEIIVVLIVIALVSGVFLLNIGDLRRSQAFLDESNILLNQLRLAQDLMQVMDTDVQVSFKAEGGKIISKIIPISQPPPLGRTIVDRSQLTFSAIGPLFFEDINGTILENDFVLTFFSRGFVMNHGALKFGPSTTKEPTLVIPFPGYLQPFITQPVSSYKNVADIKEQTLIEKVTEATRREVDYEKEPEEKEDAKPKEPDASPKK